MGYMLVRESCFIKCIIVQNMDVVSVLHRTAYPRNKHYHPVVLVFKYVPETKFCFSLLWLDTDTVQKRNRRRHTARRLPTDGRRAGASYEDSFSGPTRTYC
ncbi:unnamed protein product [Amoebophrya sp. A120]|nr:unnamed protein product [Amoebophrya sp. A120]|eukprot:GSA120T00016185001.1